MKEVVIFWDIDGTLLSTARAGIFALEDAFLAAAGHKLDLDRLPTGGLTDAEIVVNILEHARLEAKPEIIDQILRLYEKFLPESLSRKQGKVLPGVEGILNALSARSDVLSMLLTGNTSVGADAKLRHYGLAHHFQFGSFCNGATDRISIARKALELAHKILGGNSPKHLYVIGDTPHDIRCARSIGARAVAVASGPFPMQDLLSHEPWWALDQLPDPDVFLKKLWNKQ